MESFSEEMLKKLNEPLTKLQQIWDRIGIGKTAKETRASNVLEHVQALLNEMLAEESTLEEELKVKVKGYIAELAQLAQELNHPEYMPKEGLKVLEQERDLHKKLDSWRREKEERLREQKCLYVEEKNLCVAMSETPLSIPSSGILSEEQLAQLREHVHSLTKEKEKRFATFMKQKKEVVDLMLLLERTPGTTFEDMLVSVDEVSFCLSTDNLDTLSDLLKELLLSKTEVEMMVSNLWERLQILWERLEVTSDIQVEFRTTNQGLKSSTIQKIQVEIERCEAQKLAHLEKFVDGIRTELLELWDKCCYSEQQRQCFKHLHDTDYSEELLGLYEAEVAKMSEIYSSHKHVLDQVARWKTLFQQMVECECRKNDPNRLLSNRGGKLLQEEKERKSVMKHLLKAEQCMKNEVDTWEQEHSSSFMYNGEPLIQMVQKTWNDFEQSKIDEKEEKQRAKARMMNEEMLYGSKPSTPRRLAAINTNRTLRHKKVDETKTSSHSSSLFVSPYKRAPVAKPPSKLAADGKTAPGTRSRRRSKRLARKAPIEFSSGFSDSTATSTPDQSHSVAAGSPYHNFLAVIHNPSTPTARRPLYHSSLATPPPPSPRARANMFRL